MIIQRHVPRRLLWLFVVWLLHLPLLKAVAVQVNPSAVSVDSVEE